MARKAKHTQDYTVHLTGPKGEECAVNIVGACIDEVVATYTPDAFRTRKQIFNTARESVEQNAFQNAIYRGEMTEEYTITRYEGEPRV